MRIPIILAVVALALSGCNANQGVNSVPLPRGRRGLQSLRSHELCTEQHRDRGRPLNPDRR
jgi:hypothetical protein